MNIIKLNIIKMNIIVIILLDLFESNPIIIVDGFIIYPEYIQQLSMAPLHLKPYPYSPFSSWALKGLSLSVLLSFLVPEQHTAKEL